ncbi:MAG: hypothetical protein MI723_05475, partial [Caulobacterales bacterium]|nr:hypothetical protein [Caulobacterales bacterium]
EDAGLVRHHLGYVKVLTPPQAASDRPLHTLDIETFGAWLDVDRRSDAQRNGSGLGLGWRSDRRDIVPLDCRVVFRVDTADQLDMAARLIADTQSNGRNICAVMDDS